MTSKKNSAKPTRVSKVLGAIKTPGTSRDNVDAADPRLVSAVYAATRAGVQVAALEEIERDAMRLREKIEALRSTGNLGGAMIHGVTYASMFEHADAIGDHARLQLQPLQALAGPAPRQTANRFVRVRRRVYLAIRELQGVAPADRARELHMLEGGNCGSATMRARKQSVAADAREQTGHRKDLERRALAQEAAIRAHQKDALAQFLKEHPDHDVCIARAAFRDLTDAMVSETRGRILGPIVDAEKLTLFSASRP